MSSCLSETQLITLYVQFKLHSALTICALVIFKSAHGSQLICGWVFAGAQNTETATLKQSHTLLWGGSLPPSAKVSLRARALMVTYNKHHVAGVTLGTFRT